MPLRRFLRVAAAFVVLSGATAVVACGSTSEAGSPAGEALDSGPIGIVGPLSADSGADATTPSSDAGTSGSQDASTDASTTDATTDLNGGGHTAEAGVLTTCSSDPKGEGFAVDGASCFNFTPTDMGLPDHEDGGLNEPEFAVRPDSPAARSSQLVLFLVGSGAKPGDVLRTGDVAKNVYGAAVSDGDAILGLTYDNDPSVNTDCGNNDACYYPTRKSVILGTAETGSAVSVSGDEGILERTAVSLRYLAASDPDGGWATFLTSTDTSVPPAQALNWKTIIVSGHSQGGGHAAAIGKMFPVLKVVQLSSTCDEVNDQAVSWTAGDSGAGTWASDPTLFWGFAAPSIVDGRTVTGDTTCFEHTKNWANLGMVASHQNDDAGTCGVPAGTDTHPQSLICADNYDTWRFLYK